MVRAQGIKLPLCVLTWGCLLPLVTACAPGFHRSWTPVQLSVTEGLQLFDPATEVKGLRLDLPYGSNTSVTGVDLGVGVNQSLEGVRGIQVGGFGNADFEGDVLGIQLGGLMNMCGGDLTGMSVASGLNQCGGRVTGAQVGAMNFGSEGFTGLQLSAFFSFAAGSANGIQTASMVNVSTDVLGIQIGAFNTSPEDPGDVTGLQLGLINNCGGSLRGIQFGLLNFSAHSPIPVLPIVNFGWGDPTPWPSPKHRPEVMDEEPRDPKKPPLPPDRPGPGK